MLGSHDCRRKKRHSDHHDLPTFDSSSILPIFNKLDPIAPEYEGLLDGLVRANSSKVNQGLA